MLRKDIGDEVDEKNDPKFKALLENILGYCGEPENKMDYVKLCLLAKDDVQKQEEKVRFEHEQVMATQSAIIAQSESKANLLQDGLKDSQIGQSPLPSMAANQDSSQLTIRQQIVAHYSRIPFTKEEILKRLIPNDAFANLANLEKIIMSDIKDINQAEMVTYFKTIAGEKSEITKQQMRDALFQEAQIKKQPHEVNIDDHIDVVFAELDLEQKNALNKFQVGQGCKYLGLNLSEAEVERLFNQYKHRDSVFMDVKGFSRLVKYEYFKDISKDRLVADRLNEVIRLVDPRGVRRINETQLRALFSKLGAIPTDLEVKAILSECDMIRSDQKDLDHTINLDKLSNLVTHISPIFNTEREDLINGLIKIRSNLYLNVSDQFQGFKFMPRNYVASFSDDLYMNGNQNLPTSVFKPILADTKSYYVNLFSPSTTSDAPLQNKIPKFLRPSKHSAIYEIILEKATGVPIPDDSLVRTSEIVGREVRVCIFEDNRSSYVANCINLECQWKFEYEDRFYFEVHDIPKENVIYVKLPEVELNSRDKKYLVVFELVNFVRKEKSQATLAMTAGFAKLVLSDVQQDKSFSLEITGGSPVREKSVPISPDDIRHKRRGFFPKLASIFEGKIKSQLAIKVRPLRFNPNKLTEHEEELELLPDMGVFLHNQVRIQACFRQCLGRDAFSVSGTVANTINKGLPSEIYVNTFCNIFCVPICATTLSHFWNSNVAVVYEKDRYDVKMDILKLLFNMIYPTINSLNFRFQKHYPTDQLYGRHDHMEERKRLLKNILEEAWIRINEYFPTKKPVQARFFGDIAKIQDTEVVTQHSTFNIQELMDDDFDIQIY
jgi:Ca2+-binding EF-hand superfamily protein